MIQNCFIDKWVASSMRQIVNKDIDLEEEKKQKKLALSLQDYLNSIKVENLEKRR